MRIANLTGSQALRERITAKQQVDASIPEAGLPGYLEMFLAHLRLLIGVPFDYLVPDARLLPDESIRFFYMDRSWTDRMVDGALAVGKIGTREQAHHQAHAANVSSQLDLTERTVRALQTNRQPGQSTEPGGIVTGFLLRSAAVVGWPTMDVRAFSQVVPPPPTDPTTPAYAQWQANANKVQLQTLRLELLSPSVLLALFDGIPELVWCEEPHHGVQFGVNPVGGYFYLHRHEANGAIEPTETPSQQIGVPMRAANPRVVAIQALHRKLTEIGYADPLLVKQTGSAALAIEMLELPWRQRFQYGAGEGGNTGAFIPKYQVAQVIAQPGLATAVKELF